MRSAAWRDTSPQRFLPIAYTRAPSLSLGLRSALAGSLVRLPQNFCNIHRSGQSNTVTLILSDGVEVAALPSFSPP